MAEEKRKVTMRSVSLLADGNTATLEVVDYVPVEILDAYVADARTRWAYVGVGEEHDAGPAGDDGETNELPHLAGKSAADFAAYGDASTQENALDEYVSGQGA